MLLPSSLALSFARRDLHLPCSGAERAKEIEVWSREKEKRLGYERW